MQFFRGFSKFSRYKSELTSRLVVPIRGKSSWDYDKKNRSLSKLIDVYGPEENRPEGYGVTVRFNLELQKDGRVKFTSPVAIVQPISSKITDEQELASLKLQHSTYLALKELLEKNASAHSDVEEPIPFHHELDDSDPSHDPPKTSKILKEILQKNTPKINPEEPEKAYEDDLDHPVAFKKPTLSYMDPAEVVEKVMKSQPIKNPEEVTNVNLVREILTKVKKHSDDVDYDPHHVRQAHYQAKYFIGEATSTIRRLCAKVPGPACGKNSKKRRKPKKLTCPTRKTKKPRLQMKSKNPCSKKKPKAVCPKKKPKKDTCPKKKPKEDTCSKKKPKEDTCSKKKPKEDTCPKKKPKKATCSKKKPKKATCSKKKPKKDTCSKKKSKKSACPPKAKKPECPPKKPKKPDCPPKKSKKPVCPTKKKPKKPDCPPKKSKKPDCPPRKPKKTDCPTKKPKKPDCPPRKKPKKPDCPPKKQKCEEKPKVKQISCKTKRRPKPSREKKRQPCVKKDASGMKDKPEQICAKKRPQPSREKRAPCKEQSKRKQKRACSAKFVASVEAKGKEPCGRMIRSKESGGGRSYGSIRKDSDGESKDSPGNDIMEVLPTAFKHWCTWGEDPTKCGQYFHTHLNHQYTFHDVLQHMKKQRAHPQPSACRKEDRYCKPEKEDENHE